MRRRLLAALFAASFALLALAPVAGAHDGGQGTYGPTNDVVVTNAGFMIIAAVPIFVALASLLQWKLDKRKHAREDAKHGHGGSGTQHRGGW